MVYGGDWPAPAPTCSGGGHTSAARSRGATGGAGRGCQHRAEMGGSDGRVVVAPPQGIDRLARPQDPADAQAGESVGLGQATGDEGPLGPSPERGGQVAEDLGAVVDLVGDDPGPHAPGGAPARTPLPGGPGG